MGRWKLVFRHTLFYIVIKPCDACFRKLKILFKLIASGFLILTYGVIFIKVSSQPFHAVRLL
jgi:hypothetical protein